MPYHPDQPSARFTVLDLFAGAGGFTEGFKAAKMFRTARAVEMDQVAAATYEANHGRGTVFAGPIDDWLRIEETPDVDLVIGGPPCQGFSTLGLQNEEDQRNRLWLDYARTIVRAQPRYFVLENVGAFVRSPQFAALQDATERGGLLEHYTVEAGVLNAADFGAAQNRRRTIVIGHHRDLPAPGLPAASHLGRPTPLRAALRGVRADVGPADLPDSWVDVAGRPQPGVFRSRQLHLGRKYTSVSLARIRTIPPGGNRTDIPDQLLPECWRKHRTGAMDVMGRLSWDKPSVTIRTEFYKPEKGRYLHPSEDRAITHFEAARIQGFPDSYRWIGSKVATGRQIGNAVPIALGTAIARHLADCLS